jgi:CDP-diacylglycerol--glycerol-3-phosphate 3-phosphatidyltransferase
MEAEKPKPKIMTPTEWMRSRMKGVVEPIADVLIKLGVTPNMMTLAGLGLNILGALLIAGGAMVQGGLLILIGGPFDALDGTMARRLGQPSKFGAFVDSVTDRWSEMFIFMGLLYYYLSNSGSEPNWWLYCLLVFAATMGSLMVSYTKSRAETLGFDCNVGILTRMERYLVMAPGLVFNLPWLALWIVAILANFTALQRVWHVRAQAWRPDKWL